MSAYPLVYEQDPPIKRSRLTVFFRGLLYLPHAIFGMFYGIAAFFVAFAAWFVILFTGRYPTGMYDFVAGALRYTTRVYGYILLLADAYPPFDGNEHPDYPVRLRIGPPQEKYNRLTVFFRFILAIPIFILEYLFEIWIFVMVVVIWFVAVVTGKTSPGLTKTMLIPISYYARANGYVYLLTDRYPTVVEN